MTMTMHTASYCTRLGDLDPAQAVNAIHAAFLQLSALSREVDCGHYDNAPVLAALAACLKQAGHPGFTGE